MILPLFIDHYFGGLFFSEAVIDRGCFWGREG